MAYLSDGYRYALGWDTNTETATYTVKGVNADGEATNVATDSYTATHTLMEWWGLLNQTWISGVLDEEYRLGLIANLEETILLTYYTVPVMYSFGASLISYKTDYITYEYNTFMGYGGTQYMTYNYTDAEWTAWVAANSENGELNYK
jgi:hypothetical protein